MWMHMLVAALNSSPPFMHVLPPSSPMHAHSPPPTHTLYTSMYMNTETSNEHVDVSQHNREINTLGFLRVVILKYLHVNQCEEN